VAEEAARRASVAIENTLLYAAEHAARADAERASQSKDRFLAVLSHALRAPLTPVLEARRIDDLLDLTHITQNELELHPIVLDLHEKTRHVVQNCRGELDQKQLTVHIALDATARFIHGDRARRSPSSLPLPSPAPRNRADRPWDGTGRRRRKSGGVWCASDQASRCTRVARSGPAPAGKRANVSRRQWRRARR
jgi:hypothetical protein